MQTLLDIYVAPPNEFSVCAGGNKLQPVELMNCSVSLVQIFALKISLISLQPKQLQKCKQGFNSMFVVSSTNGRFKRLTRSNKVSKAGTKTEKVEEGTIVSRERDIEAKTYVYFRSVKLTAT